ncbi:MAG: riboflavin synthase [Bacteroidota bacterium]
MFTGIIETLGTVVQLEKQGGNLNISVKSSISSELQIDQSVMHNGVCLTVVALEGDTYTVTAIEETLQKTNLGELQIGSPLNLERGLQIGSRLDGHIVQGHVDQTGGCIGVSQKDGSWLFTFEYEPSKNNVTIEKGSITVDGVSLTVVDSKDDRFSVAIIPYTFENTLFKHYKPGTVVNLEFDVIGKYVARLLAARG